MNITSATIDQLKREGYSFLFTDNNATELPPEKATDIYIMNCINPISKEVSWFTKTIKAPFKKEIPFNYIINKINTDKIFINLSNTFQKLINKTNINVYAATYGIGVWTTYNKYAKEESTEIESLLKKYNIDYTTGYSEMRWVYRFKISKSKENINKIQAININNQQKGSIK